MYKPVCVKCGLTMHVEQNGVVALETTTREKDIPYRIWRADKWKCPGCDMEVLSGFGNVAVYPDDHMYKYQMSAVEVTFY